MTPTPAVTDLLKARKKVVDFRREEAKKLADGFDLSLRAAALRNAQLWIEAIDAAIKDEIKTIGERP